MGGHFKEDRIYYSCPIHWCNVLWIKSDRKKKASFKLGKVEQAHAFNNYPFLPSFKPGPEPEKLQKQHKSQVRQEECQHLRITKAFFSCFK